MLERIEVIIEKGTNRSAFFNKKVSKYNWVSLGSSYILNEISAAMLSSQLPHWKALTNERLSLWSYYYEGMRSFNADAIRLPTLPKNASHNGHIFYFHVPEPSARQRVLASLLEQGIQATTHFEPLHLANAGLKYGRTSGSLNKTETASATLIRLPLWNGMTKRQQDRVLLGVFHSISLI